MEVKNEGCLIRCPKAFQYSSIKALLNQMENCVYKIKIDEQQGTIFPCYIPIPFEKMYLPVLITNNHIINEKNLDEKDKEIYINLINQKRKTINLNNRIKYTKKEHDITIIEIKENDGIKNFLELDDSIINDIINYDYCKENYEDETIYIIQFPEGELWVSCGLLKKIYKGEFYIDHNCNTKLGSSGSPILNQKNKVIAVHTGAYSDSFNRGSFLNEAIKEFIEKYKSEKLLKKFSKKYNLNSIKDTNVKQLAIGNKIIGDEGFNDLSKIQFNELKDFRLNCNEITDIKVLQKVRFEKLEKLHLINNNISNINVLEKVNFLELKDLNLSTNKLSDISVLSKAKFEKLESLCLSYNKISDISVLEKVNFKELKELDFAANQISDIRVLAKVKFEKLESLVLSNNKISDINVFKNVNFQELKLLLLYGNEISDINVFEYVKFNKLKLLSLALNKITDIGVIEKVNFKELYTLGFSKNRIKDPSVLVKAKFEKLKKLSLDDNGIDEEKYSSVLSFLWEKYDCFYYSENQKVKDLKDRTSTKFFTF